MKKFSNTPIIYLANPYTHKSKKVMRERYLKVDKAAAHLFKLGVMTYPPIALNARWTKYEDFGHSWEAWEAYDKNFLERCDGLLVLMLDGWEKSVGVQSEIDYARELGIPIGYVTFEDVMNDDIDGVFNLVGDIVKRESQKPSWPKCVRIFR